MRRPSRISMELENLVEVYARMVDQKLKGMSVGCVSSSFYGRPYGHTFYNFSVQAYPIVDGYHKDDEVLSIVSFDLDGKKMRISKCFVNEPYAGALSKTVPELREKLGKSGFRYRRSLNLLLTDLENRLKDVSTGELPIGQAHADVLLKLFVKDSEREFRKANK